MAQTTMNVMHQTITMNTTSISRYSVSICIAPRYSLIRGGAPTRLREPFYHLIENGPQPAECIANGMFAPVDATGDAGEAAQDDLGGFVLGNDHDERKSYLSFDEEHEKEVWQQRKTRLFLSLRDGA